MLKKTNNVIDIFVWLGVVVAAAYFGFLSYDPFASRMTVIALIWLAGYWTLRTHQAMKESAGERIEIETESREIKFQKERLEAFLELSHDGIIILDKDNNVLRINDSITAITGYTKSEVIGQQISNVFKCEKYQETGLSFGLAFLTDQKPDYYEEVTFTTKDGRPIDLGVHFGRAKKHEGHRGASLILIRDLTKIHAAESLEHDFVSMTSHQLFTPLSIIRGHISMLLDGDVGKMSEKQNYFLNQSLQATKRMVHLVSELLSISRLEERKITLNFTTIKINELIPSLIDEMMPLSAHKKIKMTYKKPSVSLPAISVDTEKISQVLQNLIDNAIKYTPNGGTVTVACEPRAHDVLISITDSGIGVPTGETAKLFQRFYRCANAVNVDSKGTGLGLYIARVIVERHNGKIWVESTEGKGSTFYIALPR